MRSLLLLCGFVVMLTFRAPVGAGVAGAALRPGIAAIDAAGSRVAIASEWGFNPTNATAALQGAIASGAAKVVVPDMGQPWIVEPIFLESNQEIFFQPGVRVMALGGAFRGPRDALFSAINKENIVLRGPGAEWVMRKEDYVKPPYEQAEWRHTLNLRGCRNVLVSGLTLRRSGGDGIYIGRGTGEEGRSYCEDIVIEGVVCDDNHRQGISVISVRGLRIENCDLINTSGTAPQAGIDFEPNHAAEVLVECVMTNCRLQGNAGPALLLALHNLARDPAKAEPISLLVEGCTIDGGLLQPAVYLHCRVGVAGEIVFRGNSIKGRKRLDNCGALEVRFN